MLIHVVALAIHAHVHCNLYFHMTLQCDPVNYEHLKYLKNVYCVTTNHSKDQDTRTGYKTTN